jgi:hypothetical protein
MWEWQSFSSAILWGSQRNKPENRNCQVTALEPYRMLEPLQHLSLPRKLVHILAQQLPSAPYRRNPVRKVTRIVRH